MPEAVKQRRLAELIETYRRRLHVRSAAEVGRRHLVLVEGPSRRSGRLVGRLAVSERGREGGREGGSDGSALAVAWSTLCRRAALAIDAAAAHCAASSLPVLLLLLLQRRR